MSVRPEIPVMLPRLPSARELAPYLEEIDATRRYANFGGIVRRFEDALEAHFEALAGTVVSTCNATLGLAVALAEAALPGRRLCVLPAWTFAATARAAEAAGFEVVLADIDPETWMLSPAAVDEILDRRPGEIGVVMPVSAFGAPVDTAAWGAWRDRRGVPVVLDSAAGFDTAKASSLPTVVSLHATKVFGVGEGGCVIAPDADFAERLRRRTNFGLPAAGPVSGFAVNAKLSEYAAAVGLAALARWSERRRKMMEVARRYAGDARLTETGRFQSGFGVSWVGSTANIALHRLDAETAARHLAAQGIETRRWWKKGVLDREDRATGDFANARTLNARVLGLPFFHDLDQGDQHRVAGLLSGLS